MKRTFYVVLVLLVFQMVASASSDTTYTYSICAESSVQLDSSVIQGLYYTWEPVTGLSDDSISNPVVSPSQTTTYVRSTWIPDSTRELIINGNFEQGNTGFWSAYDFKSSGDLYLERTYTVDKNPADWHTDWSPCEDHTLGNGNGKMMIVNGDNIDYAQVWVDTVSNILPNQDYAFSAWLENIHFHLTGPYNWPLLQFSINDQPQGKMLTTTNVNCQWLRFYLKWFSGTNGSAIISIVNRHLYTEGNDFALDDISFAPIIPIIDTFVVVVKPYPVDSLGPDKAVPYDGSVSLDAGNPGALYTWSTGENTQKIIINNIKEPMTVTVNVNLNGCDSTFDIYLGAECTEIVVPNVFTPDKPPNHRIVVQGSGINNLDFMIFNRQGEMVFHSKDQGTGWDGTFKGVAQPMDVYMYYLKVQCFSGGTVEKKGSITLIR